MEKIDIENKENIKRRKRSLEINEEEYNLDAIDVIIDNIKEINLNQSNHELMLKLIKKMTIIEKKIDDFIKIETKLEKINKKIDEISSEKDYVIDNLKDEIYNLKNHINEIENKTEKKYSGDYFY